MDFSCGPVLKKLPDNAGGAGDPSSIHGSGRSPGVENGNLFQYSCLENYVLQLLDMTESLNTHTHTHTHY